MIQWPSALQLYALGGLLLVLWLASIPIEKGSPAAKASAPALILGLIVIGVFWIVFIPWAIIRGYRNGGK